MSTPKFANVHNLAVFLSKPIESEGFKQIINFLNANHIKYALTMNPTIYTSCIEQFWATAKAKNINREAHIHAKVDEKKVTIFEATIMRDLKFEDEGGVDWLSNEVIFEQLSDVLDLETTKIAQAKEISSLKKRVKILEKKKRSGTHGLKRLYNVGQFARVESFIEEQSLGKEDSSKQGKSIADIDVDAEMNLVDETIEDQGRYNDQEMFDIDVLNNEEVFVDDVNAASIETAVSRTDVSIDDITLAQALVEIKTSKPKERGIIMQKPSETPTTTTIPISSKVQDKGK
nr:hypothetical protein [Tanacetum cinerariifolium]